MTRTRQFLLTMIAVISLTAALGITWALSSLRSYNTLYDETAGTSHLMESLEDFTLQAAYRLEPDFTYVSGSDLKESDIKQIQNTMLDNTAYGYDVLSRDPNFHYSVTSKDASLQSQEKPDAQDEDSYTVTFQFKDGKLKGSGSLLGYGFAPQESRSLRSSLEGSSLAVYNDQTGEFIERSYEIPSDLTFHFPEDLTFTYSIPKEPAMSPQGSGYLYNLLVDESLAASVTLSILVLALGLQFLLLLHVPLKVEETTAPWSFVARNSLETNALLLGILSVIAGISAMLLAKLALHGDLMTLAVAGGAKTGVVFSRLVLFTAYTLILLFFSVPLFWIRQIFATGVGCYVHGKSRILESFRKGTVNLAQNILTRRMSIPLILNILCLLLIILTGSPGLAVLYGILLTAALTILAFTVQKGWKTVTGEADRLANGDFKSEPEGDPTLFRPIYDRLLAVRRSFQQALQEGIESTNMRNELISNVSHDLKTPLTGLRSYSELLEITDDPEQMRKYAGKISQYTSRLNSLVTDLFDVSKANAGSLHLDPVHLALDQLIYQALEEAETNWRTKDLQAVISLREAKVLLDPDKTMRIFENLFSNVSKYALKGTRVFVTLRETPTSYVVNIKNTSAAPLNFTAEEITERFVRGDKSRHEVGSGLGLAIVKSFAEVQHGRFRIEIDGDLFRAIVVLPKPEDLPPVPDAQAADDNSIGPVELTDSADDEKEPQ